MNKPDPIQTTVTPDAIRRSYLGRRAASIENEHLRVTVTEEGGHIAEIFHKRTGVNPLWTPHWQTGEPSSFGAEQERIFGDGVDARLLYGILGHNTCLDLFGPPSDAEAAAGMTAHGEASLLRYELAVHGGTMVCCLHMPLAQLHFQRTLTLHGEDVRIHEQVRNLAAFDRPLAWTQHVTLSPPFLNPATTEFRVHGDRAMVAFVDPGNAAYLQPGAEFEWPHAPLANGTATVDAQRMKARAPASSHIAVRMRPGTTGWSAWSPESGLAISYVWNAEEFPWIGIWEENQSRPQSPWMNQAVTRGMEFGMQPFAETRREAVERNRVLDTSTYRWLPALAQLEVTYWVRTAVNSAVPETWAFPSTG
jgi:hypothetical protein